MVSKQQMMSFIERTSNTPKNPPKQPLSNPFTFQPDTVSPIKKINKIPSKSISILSLQSPRSATIKPLNSTKHKESDQNKKLLIKFSVEFVKNLANTLKDIETLNDLKAKKNAELTSKEFQVLNKAKLIIEEHKKIVQSAPMVSSMDKYEKSFMFFAKETAEELSFLEKKCKELEDDNMSMRSVVGIVEGYEKVDRDVDGILGYLKGKTGPEDESIGKGFMTGKISRNYGVSIKEVCDKWAEEHKVENFGMICKTLSRMIIEEHEAWSDASDEFASKIIILRNYKMELKDKILEKTL